MTTLVVALLAALSACTPMSVAPDAPAPSCGGEGRSRCVTQVSVGNRFGCAALADQTVWCWGRNDESQLGYESTDLCPERTAGGGTRSVACHMYPLQVVGLEGATLVSAGGAHACALLSSGALRCWGSNTTGQLGSGTSLPSVTPIAVSGITRATAVASGSRHTCAIVDGGVQCWGANDRGQLGATNTPDQCASGGAMIPCARTPIAIAGLDHIVEIVAGDAHTCARTQSGRVQCWGAEVDGQLGAGTASAMPSPRPRTVLLGASALIGIQALTTTANHTCARRDDGAVLCWGRHDRGQLGVPVPEMFEPCVNACITTAVPVLGYEGAPSANDPDAGVEEPDDASAMDVPMPIDAPSAADVARVDAGVRDATATETSVLRDAGSATDTGTAVPTVTSIAAGGAFSCFALTDGTLRCWGSNRNSELGIGQVNEGGPALVSVIASPGSAPTNPLQNVRTVESGGTTSCAVLGDRSVRCWGSNEDGALGIGNVTEQSGPVPMTW